MNQNKHREAVVKKEDIKDDEVIVNNTAKELTAEKPVEKVGDMIRNARIKKNIEIYTVSEELRIRKVYLEAIESSNYEALPEHPYGVGFVRSYADLLGLSGSRMADLYRTELNIKDDIEKKYEVNDIDLETSNPGKKYIIISIIAVALIYFSWMLLEKYLNDFEDYDVSEVSTQDVNQDKNQEDFPLQIEDITPDEDLSVEVSEKVGVVEVVDTTGQSSVEDNQVKVSAGSYVEAEEKQTQESIKTDNVEVKVSSRIWFEVKSAQKIYVSKIFDAGSTYNITYEKGLILSVGSPSAVEVYIDGKLIKDVFTRNKKTNVELDSFLENKEH